MESEAENRYLPHGERSASFNLFSQNIHRDEVVDVLQQRSKCWISISNKLGYFPVVDLCFYIFKFSAGRADHNLSPGVDSETYEFQAGHSSVTDLKKGK